MIVDLKKIQLIDSELEKYKDRVIAFVHAKGNSERVSSKNMKLLGGVPLFCHAIYNAKNARLVDYVVIDSDSDKILEIGEKNGAIALKRPQELATNFATGDDLAYWQASNFPSSKIVLQVIPTAPFLGIDSIDNAIQMLLENPTLDSVAGVYEEAFYEWKGGRPAYYNADGTIPNSVNLPKIMYETTGMYVNHTEAVLRTRRRLNPKNCKPYVLSRLESIDINTVEDFEFAEIVYRGLDKKLTRGGGELIALVYISLYVIVIVNYCNIFNAYQGGHRL